mgnify:CR=1 FL=1
MEDSDTPGLRPGTEARSEPFPDVIEQIHRELQRLDMPCTCKEQLDRTIVAIETWRTLKLQRDLTSNIETEYAQMASGISFLSDLALLSRKPLTAQARSCRKPQVSGRYGGSVCPAADRTGQNFRQDLKTAALRHQRCHGIDTCKQGVRNSQDNV